MLTELLPGKNRIPDVVIIINKICDKHNDKCGHDDHKHDKKNDKKRDKKHDDDKDKKKHSKKDKEKDKDKKRFQNKCDFEIKILKKELDDADCEEKDKSSALELIVAPSITLIPSLTDSLGKSIGRRKNRGHKHS
ncbi:MAG: hypothetical protein GX755_02395 [Syntrophomonadaceae bacterium]|nr:hypothetical protein [Syntrophomonadaceae bacterium]